jgi:hypothetical protein
LVREAFFITENPNVEGTEYGTDDCIGPHYH